MAAGGLEQLIMIHPVLGVKKKCELAIHLCKMSIDYFLGINFMVFYTPYDLLSVL